VSKLRFRISISLDGYVAGPRQSVENPLGVGGMRLHEWVFPLTVWRQMHGMPGGEVNASSKVVEASMANIGCDDHGPQHVRRTPRSLGSREPVEAAGGARTRRFITPCSCSRITRASGSC
jgi:hypothetical protein